MLRIIWLIASLISVSAQVQDEDDCYDKLQDISLSELNLAEDELVLRQYILCKNTTFQPGILNQAGSFDGDWPLILRSKAFVKCGDETGASSNNCIIDGTGTWGILIDPISFEQEEEKRDINIKGITFEGFTKQNAGQFVVYLIASLGKLTMEDCIFDNVGSSAPFFFAQLLLDKEQDRVRSLNIANTAVPSSTGGWDFTDLNDIDMFFKAAIENAEKLTNLQGNRRRELTSPYNITSKEDVSADINENLRGLQNEDSDDGFLDAPLNIWFKNCVFKDINMADIPQTDSAHTILYFTGLVKSDLNGGPTPGQMNVRIWDTKFKNIKGELVDDDFPTRRSLIEFQSRGKFFLKNTCFSDIQIPSHGLQGVILTDMLSELKNLGGNALSNITFKEGAIPDDNTGCPFVTVYDLQGTDQTHSFIECVPKEDFTYADTCGTEPTSPPFGMCFSSENKAELANGAIKRFDQLQLGDLVSTQKGFEPIYSFGHYNSKEQAEFIQLLPSRIELSSTHLLFLQDGRAVPAAKVELGDVLLSGEVVSGKRYVTRQGLYAPFTASGTIITNGQVASSFVSLQGTPELMLNGWSTGISHQWMAHTFEMPHRLWCLAMAKGDGCFKEVYTSDGISTWVSCPLKFFNWFINAHVLIQVVLTVPILGVFGFFSVFELVLTEIGYYEAAGLVCFIGVIIIYSTPFQIRKVKCE